jgi:hypothetical protein
MGALPPHLWDKVSQQLFGAATNSDGLNETQYSRTLARPNNCLGRAVLSWAAE